MKKKSKILVTGGAGFIGSNLIGELLKKDLEIIILDNLSTGYLKNIEEYKNKINFINGDICDYKLVSKLMDDVDIVYHLAAFVSVPKSLVEPRKCFEVNVLASINLIEECIKHKSKFIFASSASVYGADKTPIKTEELETIPISPYGLSKLDIERICEIYRKSSNLEYVCFRNFNVYGPKQDINSSYAAAIPSFITKALKNVNLTIYGDGEQTRDFIYVGDVADAYILGADKKINGVFNLGCNEIISIVELSKFILKETKSKSKIITENQREGDIKHSRGSSEKYKLVSNFKPMISLDEGIKKTINYYKKNG